MVDDGHVGSKDDVVGGQFDVRQGVFKGDDRLGRQQESCFWRFSAFSALAIHAFSRSSSPGSYRCCSRKIKNVVIHMQILEFVCSLNV